ncbi:MAG TPA: hypothetical protein VK335_26915 [Bryobacteraceae bacterium]|nr:hypothetical protein [Bryobacteraceae bacterium]
MVEVSQAAVTWDAEKKRWVIRFQIGAEVFKRPGLKTARDADDESLRSMAVQVAQDDGYQLSPAAVTVSR